MKIQAKAFTPVSFEVDIHDVIHGINEMPIESRMNVIARILNEVEYPLPNDVKLEHKMIVKNWIEKQYKKVNP